MKAYYRPEEVARETGLSAQYIRVNMESGAFPIGIVVRKDGKKRADYKIFPKMLYDVTGFKIDGYEPEPVVVAQER